MIDRSKTEWLFYKSINRYAVGADKWDDEKWLELRFPNKKIFCNQIRESDLDDFVGTLVWIFRDRYPLEFSGLETSMWGPDDRGVPKFEHINTRKLQDIEPLLIEEGDYMGIEKLAIQFKQVQPNVFTWIETELEDKLYTKEGEQQVIYHITDSPIERIEATKEGFTIYVNQKRVIY